MDGKTLPLTPSLCQREGEWGWVHSKYDGKLLILLFYKLMKYKPLRH
jgi:hypothetical protein